MQCPAKILAIVDDYVKISYAYLCKFFVSRDLNVRDMVFNMYHCLNWTIADQNENWKSFNFFSFILHLHRNIMFTVFNKK